MYVHSSPSDTIRHVLNLSPTTVMEYKSNNGQSFCNSSTTLGWPSIFLLLDSMQDKSSFRNSAVDRAPVPWLTASFTYFLFLISKCSARASTCSDAWLLNLQLIIFSITRDLLMISRTHALRDFRQSTRHLIKVHNRAMSTKTKSEDEWRAVLSKEQFRILRQKVSNDLVIISPW